MGLRTVYNRILLNSLFDNYERTYRHSYLIDYPIHYYDRFDSMRRYWLVDFIKNNNFKNKQLFIYSVYGNIKKRNIKICSYLSNSKRIFYSGENLRETEIVNRHKVYGNYFLEDMDLSIGCDYSHNLALDTKLLEKYYRFPLWIKYMFSANVNLIEIQNKINNINNCRKTYRNNRPKFATLIASHDMQSNTRKPIVDLLSTINHVDCAGKYLNNTNELQIYFDNSKANYLKQFRFNICTENSNYDGYVTEKLFEAISAGCIPIYWGSDNNPEPEILNHDAILFYDPSNPNALLEEVRRLETDPEYYVEFIARPPFKEDAAEKIWAIIEGLKDRLDKVINQ